MNQWKDRKMNLFKKNVCSKTRSKVCYFYIHQSLVALSLFIVPPVFSQTDINLADDGNYALQFDGVNDYVNCAHKNIMNFGTGDFTIESWIKPNNSDAYTVIKRNGGDFWSISSSIDSDSETFGFEGGGIHIWGSTVIVNTGWHHVAAVRRSGIVSLYVDGQLENSTNISTSMDNSAPLRFGGWGDENLNGILDEIRLWNVARSQFEIQANMYSHLSGYEEGLVGYWPFNEGAGNMANDFSGNNNHGTIYGTSWISSGAPVGTLIIFCNPNYGYQNHNLFTSIKGANTHFLDGTKHIWLSKNDRTIKADRYTVHSNMLIDARFYIPSDASIGQWNINVETAIDSIVTMAIGIEIFPPPSVTSQIGNTSSWLRSVCAINDMTCWNVGNDGSIQRTVDGGINWETQTSGFTDVLYSIFFSDEMTGCAVGQYGTILKTTSGGEEWGAQNSGTSNNLQSVFFIDNQTGWTVGRLGTILITTDGGINWDSQISGTTSWLYSICFADENNGWAVGSNGTILHTTDGGMIWDSQNSGTTDYLSSIHFYDSDTAWAVGSAGTILKTVDGGDNWTVKESNTTEWLRSVFFLEAQTGWAVGTNGVLIATADGGETWSAGRSFTVKALSSLHFADNLTGWAVGETGTILNLMMSNLATQIEEKNISSPFPQDFQLFQNYPNPFNPTTAIGYQLSAVSDVELGIYNMLGQKVAVLVSKRQSAGSYQVQWDASGFASGVYYYRIKADEFQDVKKMILLR